VESSQQSSISKFNFFYLFKYFLHVSFPQLATYASSLSISLSYQTLPSLSHFPPLSFFSKSLFAFHLSNPTISFSLSTSLPPQTLPFTFHLSNPTISFSLSTSLPPQTLTFLYHFFFSHHWLIRPLLGKVMVFFLHRLVLCNFQLHFCLFFSFSTTTS